MTELRKLRNQLFVFINIIFWRVLFNWLENIGVSNTDDICILRLGCLHFYQI